MFLSQKTYVSSGEKKIIKRKSCRFKVGKNKAVMRTAFPEQEKRV